MNQSYEVVQGIDTTPIAVPPGITLAVLVSAAPAQNSLNLKYGSGGSICLFGYTLGTSLPAANFASLYAAGNFYLLGTSETLAFNGPTSFYIAQSGVAATAICYAIKGKNA